MATDPLSLVFIACFLFGLLFFIGTILLGNLGHADHAGHIGHTDLGHATHIGGHDVSHVSHTPVHSAQAQHSTTADHQGTHFSIAPYMNPTTIALFLLGFGFFGYVSHNTVQFVLPLTLVLAALGGLVVAAL